MNKFSFELIKMLQRFAFLVLIAGCLGAHLRYKRLINGTKTVHTITNENNETVEFPYAIDYPYMIEIATKTQHVCGGALIRPNIAITNGHCIFNKNVSLYAVYAGNQIRLDGNSTFAQKREVEKIVVHPKWNENGTKTYYRYDLAVLKLKEPFVLNVHVNVIKLPNQLTEEDVFDYHYWNVTVLGWGYMENNKGSKYLLKIHAEASDVCDEFEENNEYVVLCVFGFNGGKTRMGDSGGPTVVQAKTRDDDLLLAIHSHRRPDDEYWYAINLACFISWINKTIEDM